MVQYYFDNRIESSPDICGGHPHITGSRIRVIDVYMWHDGAGKSPESIAAEYDLHLADVYAAIAYYFANVEEMKTLLQEDQAFVEQIKKTFLLN